MKLVTATVGVMAACAMLLVGSGAGAQDWPQWRGPNRDAKATGFTAPKTWPKELKETWKVTVGDGVASPALVGDKLYVFSREGGDEVIRCLNTADGKEIWKEKYASAGWGGIDSSFQGPRSSPAVADGKVVTLGALGILSCFDAASGKRLWQKDDFKGSMPRFHVASSPIIVNGLAVAQLGSGRTGGVMAYDLTSGEEKWKWTGEGPGYSSPAVLSLGGTKAIVAVTAATVVAVKADDGKLLWESAFRSQYNAPSPMVDGQTVICSADGAGTKALKLEKDGDKASAKELWTRDAGTLYNTPVVKDGLIYGISATNKVFCLKADDGKTAWSTQLAGGGGGGGRGMMGGGGYGSVVDAGSVLFALTPSGQMVVFEPTDKEFKEIAKYKVGKDKTYGYPVVSGKRIFVKDSDSVTLWTIE
jgi:outer membrane protein assembly factor BamB